MTSEAPPPDPTGPQAGELTARGRLWTHGMLVGAMTLCAASLLVTVMTEREVTISCLTGGAAVPAYAFARALLVNIDQRPGFSSNDGRLSNVAHDRRLVRISARG